METCNYTYYAPVNTFSDAYSLAGCSHRQCLDGFGLGEFTGEKVMSAAADVSSVTNVLSSVVNTVKKVISGIKSLLGKKTNDAKFLAVRNAIDDVLYENGYARPDRGGISSAPSFTQFKMRDEQVSGKNTDYTYAYARLRDFLVAMFNAYKPGLGDAYLMSNPKVLMKNGYEPSDQWIESIVGTILSNPVTPGKNVAVPVSAEASLSPILGVALIGGLILMMANQE